MVRVTKFTNGSVYIGHALKVLQGIPDESVQCCVTSPPYWGLRDYQTEGQTWEGDDWVGELGAEPTPEMYIRHLVDIFKEVKRVLKKDGIFWLNLGDSYASNGIYIGQYKETHPASTNFHLKDSTRYPQARKGFRGGEHGIKKKDLVGIPWLAAFALRKDGWYLRQDIIWSKNNPMPESITDRCTKSHEYVFLLTKSSNYLFNQIREKGIVPAGTKAAKGSEQRSADKKVNSRPPVYKIYDGMRNKRSVWEVQTRPYPGAHFAVFPSDLIEPMIKAGTNEGDTVLDPFFGSGTTGKVCNQLGRKFIGIELNSNYLKLIKKQVFSFF